MPSSYLKKANLWFIIHPVFPYKLTTLQGLETKFLAGYLWWDNIEREKKEVAPLSRHKGKAGYLSAFPCWSLLLKSSRLYFTGPLSRLGKSLAKFLSSLIAPKQKREFQTPCLSQK